MSKTKYEVKYKLKDKKTGRVAHQLHDIVQAESETNAIAQLKQRSPGYDVEAVSVTPKK